MNTFNNVSLKEFLSVVDTLQRDSSCEYLFDFRGWVETKNDHRIYILIKQKDRLIGFSIVEPDAARLSRIFVEQPFRDKSILKNILDIYQIKSLGVFNNLPKLVKLYKSHGFKITNPQAKLVFNMERSNA